MSNSTNDYTRLGSIPRSLGIVFFSLLAACGRTVSVPPLTSGEHPWIEAAGNYPQGTYRLEPGDTIDVRYPFHPQMNRREIIRPDAKIRAFDEGEIVASGLTTTELAEQLRARAASQLRDPEVTVSVAEFAEKSIYVAGEVGKSGPIPYRRGLTPLQALVQAGGLLPTGLADSVVLVRGVGSDGRTVSRVLDIQSGILAGVRDPVELAPYDILYVPKSSVAEADVWVEQHVTHLLPFLRGAGANAQVHP